MNVNQSVRAVLRFTAGKNGPQEILKGVLLTPETAAATDRYIMGFSTHDLPMDRDRFVLSPGDAIQVARMKHVDASYVSDGLLHVREIGGEVQTFGNFQNSKDRFPNIHHLHRKYTDDERFAPKETDSLWWNLDVLSRFDPAKMARSKYERQNPHIKFTPRGVPGSGGPVTWDFHEHTYGAFVAVRPMRRSDLA